MKNLSLYFLFLVGGLFTSLSEVNASMKRVIIMEGDKSIGFIHMFCSDKKDDNYFLITHLDKFTGNDSVGYGYELSSKKYYKSFREFFNQQEYLKHEWTSDHPALRRKLAKTGIYCMLRLMSEATAIKFKENYLQYCVYPRKPKKYCISGDEAAFFYKPID